MSIIIKGMEMPKEGMGVRIEILYNGQVFLDNGVGSPTYHAIEIPTPHGRMIDADALFEAMGLDTVKEVMLRNWKYTTAWGVPIIEAEE